MAQPPLRITGVNRDASYLDENGMAGVRFVLSGTPPQEWTDIFHTVTEASEFSPVEEGTVENDEIVVVTHLEDLKAVKEELDRCVDEANTEYAETYAPLREELERALGELTFD